MSSTCCGPLVDDVGAVCKRCLCLQSNNVATASTAMSRQPPSARLMARPGTVSRAPECGGGNTGGLGGGWRSSRGPQSLQSVPNSHIDPKAFQPPSWQTVSPAVPQVSRQIIGGGSKGVGSVGGGGEGAGRSVIEPPQQEAIPVKSACELPDKMRTPTTMYMLSPCCMHSALQWYGGNV